MRATVSRRQRSSGRRPLRRLAGTLVLLLLLLIVLALLAGGAALVQSRLDPAALQARIERQVFAATGRTLTLSALHVRLLPVPMVTTGALSFADMQGGARQEMLTASGLSAHLALWPLIHHIARLEGLTLTDPDLLVERDADGSANWQMHPAQKPQGGPGSTPSGGARWTLQVDSVRLTRGKVAWQDRLRGWTGAAVLDRLDGTGLAGDSPVIDLAGQHDAAGFAVRLATGSLSRLTAQDEAGPAWPVHLTASSQRDGRQDAGLSIDGTLADPLRMRGYAVDIDLQAPRPDGLDQLFPKAAIPALGPMSLKTRLVDDAHPDAAAAAPMLERIALTAKQVDMAALVHRRWSQGLTLGTLSIDAPNRTAPVAVAADGVWRGRPLSLHGTAGTLQDWRDARAGPGRTPVDLTLVSGDAHATVKGVAGASAANLAVMAGIPALRALLATGPALTGLSVSAQVAIGPGRRFGVSGMALESRQIGMTGAATLVADGRPSITARLAASHVDVDALGAGWVSGTDDELEAAAAPEPAPGPAPATPGAGQQAPNTAAADATAGQPADSSHTVPFARLQSGDLAIDLTAASMTLDGQTYKHLVATLSLQNGVLSLSPFSVAGPAGPIAGRLDADAGKQTVSIAIQPSMLPAKTLARWLEQPPVLDGTVELVGALAASGGSSDALAASASGHLGASMVDGSIANGALSAFVGRAAGATEGRTGFRCLALPATIAGGVARLDPLALSTSRLVVVGRGTVGLSDGALDLHLLPRLSVGSTGASLPVKVGGTLRDPVASLDPAAPGGRFSLTIGGGAAPPDPCTADLAAARFGAAGPLPGPETFFGKHKLPKPIDILRGLGLFH